MVSQNPTLDSEADLKKEILIFLEKLKKPAFGALSEKEIELTIFEFMRNVGFLSKER